MQGLGPCEVSRRVGRKEGRNQREKKKEGKKKEKKVVRKVTFFFFFFTLSKITLEGESNAWSATLLAMVVVSGGGT